MKKIIAVLMLASLFLAPVFALRQQAAMTMMIPVALPTRTRRKLILKMPLIGLPTGHLCLFYVSRFYLFVRRFSVYYRRRRSGQGQFGAAECDVCNDWRRDCGIGKGIVALIQGLLVPSGT